MKRTLGSLLLTTHVISASAAAQRAAVPSPPSDIVRLVPTDLRWQTLPQFTDGRERALLFGRPEADGDWVYRVRIPRPIRVDAHTHPVDESITVLEENWSFGLGRVFDASKLVAYPPGAFVRIPANTPHFAATSEGPVVIQSSGSGVFSTVPAN